MMKYSSRWSQIFLLEIFPNPTSEYRTLTSVNQPLYCCGISGFLRSWASYVHEKTAFRVPFCDQYSLHVGIAFWVHNSLRLYTRITRHGMKYTKWLSHNFTNQPSNRKPIYITSLLYCFLSRFRTNTTFPKSIPQGMRYQAGSPRPGMVTLYNPAHQFVAWHSRRRSRRQAGVWRNYSGPNRRGWPICCYTGSAGKSGCFQTFSEQRTMCHSLSTGATISRSYRKSIMDRPYVSCRHCCESGLVDPVNSPNHAILPESLLDKTANGVTPAISRSYSPSILFSHFSNSIELRGITKDGQIFPSEILKVENLYENDDIDHNRM